MYLDHFGLAEPPFSITPDPRFVFLSERHRDALAHLSFGVGQGGGGGFVQLTGEVGTGKTTLCRLLLEQLPDNTRVALVLNPRVSPVELLETACEELGLEIDGRRGSIKPLVDVLNAYLLEAYSQGLRVVLIIDEAQNLSFDALEQVRLLTNLETPTQKLLQIILLGQPELRTMLARDDLRQLAQRITARYHLMPLSEPETGDYLRHRFAVAGGTRLPFTPGAVQRIHARTGGVPRLINVVADRTLLAGYVLDRTTLDEATVDRAADEALAPASIAHRTMPRAAMAAMAAALALALGAGVIWWRQAPTHSANAPRAPVAAASPGAPRANPTAPPDTTSLAAVATTGPLDAAAFAEKLAAVPASDTAAWRELLRLWQLPADDAAIARMRACPAVPAPGLHCARGRATLEELAALGRPPILSLDRATAPAPAVLLAVDATRVRLWLDGASVDIARSALAAHWSGGYTALWSATQLQGTPLPAGGRGPVMDWLRARLGHAGPPVFDAAMRESLRRFQRANGLLADGVPGPTTRLALASAELGPQLQSMVD